MPDRKPETGLKTGTADDSRPVVSPPGPRYHPDWRERIEIARQARDQARKARGDKPTFSTRRIPI